MPISGLKELASTLNFVVSYLGHELHCAHIALLYL